jgi:hypothetical protein
LERTITTTFTRGAKEGKSVDEVIAAQPTKDLDDKGLREPRELSPDSLHQPIAAQAESRIPAKE